MHDTSFLEVWSDVSRSSAIVVVSISSLTGWMVPAPLAQTAGRGAVCGRPRRRPPHDRLIGLVIVSLLPAVFWTSLIGGVAGALGMALRLDAIMLIGVAIATFLGLVGGALLSGCD